MLVSRLPTTPWPAPPLLHLQGRYRGTLCRYRERWTSCGHWGPLDWKEHAGANWKRLPLNAAAAAPNGEGGWSLSQAHLSPGLFPL